MWSNLRVSGKRADGSRGLLDLELFEIAPPTIHLSFFYFGLAGGGSRAGVISD